MVYFNIPMKKDLHRDVLVFVRVYRKLLTTMNQLVRLRIVTET